MLLRIVHHTRYRYQAPVLLAQHLAHLRPLEWQGQQVLEHRLSVSPEPAQLQQGLDAFGNWRCFFALQSAHETLEVGADSLVQTRAPAPLPDSPPWEYWPRHKARPCPPRAGRNWPNRKASGNSRSRHSRKGWWVTGPSWPWAE